MLSNGGGRGLLLPLQELQEHLEHHIELNDLHGMDYDGHSRKGDEDDTLSSEQERLRKIQVATPIKIQLD